jgi:hypothetical protein
MDDYSWVTTEMFDEALEAVVREALDMSPHSPGFDCLVVIPGVYEILSEHYNNDVLKRLDEQRDE